MLSKVSDSTVTKTLTLSFKAASQTMAQQSITTDNDWSRSRIIDNTVAEIPEGLPTGTISINAPYKMETYTCKIGTAKNGTYQNDGVQGTANSTKTFTFSKSTEGGDVRRIYAQATDTSHVAYVSRNDYFTATYIGTILIPKLGGINGKPRELKQIAQKANITIFGLHTDNTRITQDVE